MADLTSFLQAFKSSSSYNSLLGADPNMELLLNQTHENTNLNYSHHHCFMGSSSNDQISFFGTTQQANGTTTAAAADHHQQQLLVPSGVLENYPAIFHNHDEKNIVMMMVDPGIQPSLSNPAYLEIKKRKPKPASDVGNSTLIERKHSAGNKGKKIKVMNGKEEGIPKEVVHIRARRGQATDSHSLAERVRRGKINERLRCLQDIVPGCYKTMGMAVMLDEIINYVQSLQNQVEFLSMKLTEASSFHNFNNSEMDHAVQLLKRAKTYNYDEEEKKNSVEREVERENGCTMTVPPTQINGPFDPNFGTFPSLPYI